ncbi:MAG: MFS transporter [Candidatus Tectomicrobia bacterium]
MKRFFDFASITCADFIVRSAYQMGKTPLLPIFASQLGANSAFLGIIVAVSTCTGMILKPLIGLLSDRWGRRWWLLLGTVFFAVIPLLYRFVHSPEHLFAMRMVHGLATAIYGPVTLAFVVEHSQQRRAENLGWFGMARHAGYIIGPAVSGWLLSMGIDPVSVFTLIGLMSMLAFVPICLLSEPASRPTVVPIPLRQHIVHALQAGSRTLSVWLAGGLEATVLLALYAAKAFLPLYALSLPLSLALVGAFFAVQEATHMLCKPVGGRLGDQLGYGRSICLGMVVLGGAFLCVPWTRRAFDLITLAVVMGGAQALIFPATVALVSRQIGNQHVGAGMGLVGMLKNAGKIAGPILGGFLMHWLNFALMLQCMGLLLLAGAGGVWFWAQRTPRRVEA